MPLSRQPWQRGKQQDRALYGFTVCPVHSSGAPSMGNFFDDLQFDVSPLIGK
jgi:hypothetical protein